MMRQIFTTTLVFAMVGGTLASAATYKEMLRDAHRGDVVAMRKIGYNQFTGSGGVTQNRKTGLAWLKRAAQRGDTQALYYLGCIYQNGVYVGMDKEEAARNFTIAAAKGHEKAKKKLAELNEEKTRPAEEKVAPEKAPAPSPKKPAPVVEKEKEKDKPTEVPPTTRSASIDAKAEYQKGQELEKTSPPKAFSHYEAAAKQGHSQAQFRLGMYYHDGIVVPKNDAEAFKWFKKAAEQGHIDAQFELALCYEKGMGTGRDPDEAVKWYRRSAERGNVWAQYHLGVCYMQAVGTPKNETEAAKWFRRAAEQGDAISQYMLGNAYLSGIGVPQNDEEALKWTKKSADQGYADAQHSMGVFYIMGWCTSKNLTEGKKWLEKAAKQGFTPSQKLLDKLKEKQ